MSKLQAVWLAKILEPIYYSAFVIVRVLEGAFSGHWETSREVRRHL